MCGTPVYLAPEVILRDSKETYNHLVDSWSVGVIVFAMWVVFSLMEYVRLICILQRIANSQPFIDDDASVMAIRFRRRYIDWSLVETQNVSPDCRQFLEVLLEENPEERMSCTDALRHPWLAPLSANDPEALDNTRNDSILSTTANAGSFTEVADTPHAALRVPLPEETPASQELRSAGITGNFERIRMDETSLESATSAVPEVEPRSQASQTDPSTSRSQGRRLERQPMQIAEYDTKGQLTSFRPFTEGPAVPGPEDADGVNGEEKDSEAENESGPASSPGQRAETDGTTHDGQNEASEDKELAEPAASLTSGTDNEDENGQVSVSNSRKRGAPGSQEPEDTGARDEVRTKRTRAIAADVAS